jgi:ureidoglycolate lyase
MLKLTPEPLTKAGFAAFGDVVELDGTIPIEINQGFARRFNALATVDVINDGGSVNISLFEARPRPQPIAIKLMERHPLGTQLFMPLQDKPWLVVVCADPHDPASYRAFAATGRQGVNYGRNVWHHPLLILAQDLGQDLGDDERFMVVDRAGQDNLEEVWLDQPLSLILP